MKEMKEMKELVGKTVETVRYVDPWGEGLRIAFTDGTFLHITELMQAGEIQVKVNDQTAEYEYDFED